MYRARNATETESVQRGAVRGPDAGIEMILRPFSHTEPVAISYLFGCGGRGCGAVVDPVGDIETYLRAAEASGMRILYVIDTHIHADHVSAGRRLASAAGARYVLAAQVTGAGAFETVRDRDVLELGNVSVEVLHTPGHTPEHVSLLVTDRTRAHEPWFVMTGHTLMVGDVGRTKALPDYVEVLPGAFSGSVCGRSLSGKPFSTIGFERRHNAGFRIDEEAAFVRFMSADIPVPPPGAAELRAVNAGLAA